VTQPPKLGNPKRPDGTALRDADGKIRRYSPVVSFEARTAGQRFSTAIVAAPRVLEDAGVAA
jgi:hypothetical protein